MFLNGSDFRPVYPDNIDRVGRISFFCGALRPGSTFFRAVRAYLSPVFAIVSLAALVQVAANNAFSSSKSSLKKWLSYILSSVRRPLRVIL